MASQTVDLTNEAWEVGSGNGQTGEFPPDEHYEGRIRCLDYFYFSTVASNIVINATGTAPQYEFTVYFYSAAGFLYNVQWSTASVSVPVGAVRYRVIIRHPDNSTITPEEISKITATIEYGQQTVRNWNEFISAIGVQDAVVVLPENAVWDMNEILPYGLTENINIACKAIYGNGTRIKNLNLNSYYFNYDGTDVKYFQDLLMTDWIGTNKFFNLRYGSLFTRCAISGITSNAVVIDNSNSYNYSTCIMISCSVNVEGSHSQFQLIDDVSELKYCRIELHGVNSTNSSPAGSSCDYCELSLYFPNAETGSYGFPMMYYRGCVLHGNMKSVTQCYEISEWSGQPTVFDIDMFGDGFVSTKPQYFIPCTDAQLKDPAYLRSKGFPIVVNGGG